MRACPHLLPPYGVPTGLGVAGLPRSIPPQPQAIGSQGRKKGAGPGPSQSLRRVASTEQMGHGASEMVRQACGKASQLESTRLSCSNQGAAQPSILLARRLMASPAFGWSLGYVRGQSTRSTRGWCRNPWHFRQSLLDHSGSSAVGACSGDGWSVRSRSTAASPSASLGLRVG